MIITIILACIGVFGTLTIVAYLRQVEEGMAELQEQLDSPVCPVCQGPHLTHSHKKANRSLRGIKSYYKRKRRAASRFYRSEKQR